MAVLSNFLQYFFAFTTVVLNYGNKLKWILFGPLWKCCSEQFENNIDEQSVIIYLIIHKVGQQPAGI